MKSSFVIPTVFAFLLAILVSPAAWAACGCKSMTVAHADSAMAVICSNNLLKDFAECARGPGTSKGCSTTYAYTCPVGVNTNIALSQKTGFLVDAELTGTATECKSGQALQLTLTSDQKASKPKVLGPPAGDVTIGSLTATITSDRRRLYPDVGATAPTTSNPYFGGDAYTNVADTDLLMDQIGGHLRWWDNTDQAKDKDGETATWKYRFFSFVQGTSSQHCACVFDVDVDWKAKSKPTTSWKRIDKWSTSCNF
jgi:hypothetical protein